MSLLETPFSESLLQEGGFEMRSEDCNGMRSRMDRGCVVFDQPQREAKEWYLNGLCV